MGGRFSAITFNKIFVKDKLDNLNQTSPEFNSHRQRQHKQQNQFLKNNF